MWTGKEGGIRMGKMDKEKIVKQAEKINKFANVVFALSILSMITGGAEWKIINDEKGIYLALIAFGVMVLDLVGKTINGIIIEQNMPEMKSEEKKFRKNKTMVKRNLKRI